jgi:hypothetical protein
VVNAWKQQRHCEYSGGQWRDGRCVHRETDVPEDEPDEPEPRASPLTLDLAAAIVDALNSAGVAYLVVVREPDRRGFADRPEVRSPEEFVRFLLALREGH